MPHVTDLYRQRVGRFGTYVIGGPQNADLTIDAEREQLQRLDALTAYGSVWTGEWIGGKEVLTHLGIWLAATQRIAVGSGVASVWARPPEVAQGAAATLAEAYPGRLALGVGIGYREQAELVGGDFTKPVHTLREYLDRMDREHERQSNTEAEFPRVIAALGPRMIELAAEHADGIHTFFTTPEHTADARRRLGPRPLIVAQQQILVDPSPEMLAEHRELLAYTARIPHYANALTRAGLTEIDIEEQTARFYDALTITGSVDDVAAKVGRHLDAGADHVLLVPYGGLTSAVDQLEKLAPGVKAS